MPVDGGAAVFSVHFDGPITTDHLVSLRVMSKTYECMQRSIDRSYLICKYGAVWKHARLSQEDYREIEFFAAYPREGGIYIDAVRGISDTVGRVIDQIAVAIRSPYEAAVQGGMQEFGGFDAQWSDMSQRSVDLEGVPLVERAIAENGAAWSSAYSQRSIQKEIDALVSQVVPERNAGSIVDLRFHGSSARDVFQFTPEVASRFHSAVGKRTLGAPFRVGIRIRSLDRGNDHMSPGAKVLNVQSNREVILHLHNIGDFDVLRPFHDGSAVEIVACPLLENGGYDPNGGDLVFIRLGARHG